MSEPPLYEYVETRPVPISQLTRFPGNARRGDVDTIRGSLRKNGQYRSLVVRDTGTALVILAGNHTRDAAHAEGWAEVRCEILRCDDHTARRINLADNRAAELGTTDNDSLAELLSYLNGEYEGTGYTESFVDHLLDGYGPSGPDVNGYGPDGPDDAPPRAKVAPDEFPAYDDDIKTDYACPRCAYSWSGKPK